MITKCYDEISIGLIFSWAWLQNAVTRFQWGLIFSRKEQLLAKEFRFCCGKSCFFAHRRILQTKYRVSVRMLSVVLDSWCFCACWPFLISFFFCQQRSFFPFFYIFFFNSFFFFPVSRTIHSRLEGHLWTRAVLPGLAGNKRLSSAHHRHRVWRQQLGDIFWLYVTLCQMTWHCLGAGCPDSPREPFANNNLPQTPGVTTTAWWHHLTLRHIWLDNTFAGAYIMIEVDGVAYRHTIKPYVRPNWTDTSWWPR